jgi:hypothetical protein
VGGSQELEQERKKNEKSHSKREKKKSLFRACVKSGGMSCKQKRNKNKPSYILKLKLDIPLSDDMGNGRSEREQELLFLLIFDELT